MESDSVRSI